MFRAAPAARLSPGDQHGPRPTLPPGGRIATLDLAQMLEGLGCHKTPQTQRGEAPTRRHCLSDQWRDNGDPARPSAHRPDLGRSPISLHIAGRFPFSAACKARAGSGHRGQGHPGQGHPGQGQRMTPVVHAPVARAARRSSASAASASARAAISARVSVTSAGMTGTSIRCGGGAGRARSAISSASARA